MAWLTFAVLAQAFIIVGLATLIAVRGQRSTFTRLTVIVVGGFGLATFFSETLAAVRPGGTVAPGMQWLSDGATVGIIMVLSAIMTAKILMMASFPGGLDVRWRRRLLGFSIAPLVLGAWRSILVYAESAGNWVHATALTWTFLSDLTAGAVVVWYGTLYLRMRRSHLRSQTLYVMLAFVVWMANHVVVVPWRIVVDDLVVAPVFQALYWTSTAFLVLFGGAFLVRGMARRDRQDVALAVWTFAVLPLSLLQLLSTHLHLLVDGLFVVLFFYGVARYQIVEVDFASTSRIGRAVLGATALPVFFVAQQAVEQSAGATLGVVGGALVAGLALFGLSPLQRWLERTQGSPASPDNYQAYRRMQIYRAALEGVLRDGHMQPSESSVLIALRQQLQISPADHAALIEELRAT